MPSEIDDAESFTGACGTKRNIDLSLVSLRMSTCFDILTDLTSKLSIHLSLYRRLITKLLVSYCNSFKTPLGSKALS